MRRARTILPWVLTLVALLSIPLAAAQQDEAPAVSVDPLHKPLDTLLNQDVRDGRVYYAALKQQRATLDHYVASLDGPAVAGFATWTADARLAFWLNAYNAFVLQTVINHYPIRGTSSKYPRSSIRQIPGAFDRLQHRAAGRSVTLDQIEQQILPTFNDPRVFLALGRGALGSGRLRSEAFSSTRLEQQLAAVRAECLDQVQCAQVDRVAGVVNISPIFSWDAASFITKYGPEASTAYPGRSAIEAAVLTYISGDLLGTEKAFLKANTFRVVYETFDWRLNDLR
ncbi:MAG TPA: DUF547 domain-containing protein [Vicinamibacterales bacterium]|jgi:hypothetical protein